MSVHEPKRGHEPAQPTVTHARLIAACARELAPDEPSLAAWHRGYVEDHSARIALDLDLTQQFVRPGSAVLELGSIPLLFTAALARSGYQVTGCDVGPERYSEALRKLALNVLKCDIETQRLPFEDNCFDAVVFNELFEHLRINPIFTLREVLRVLRPGGRLLLSTPNLRSFYGIVNFLVKGKAYSCCSDIFNEYMKLELIGHMGHVREYTTREVIGFLRRVGFVPTDVIYRGQLHSRLTRLLGSLVPGLRPFVSYIAQKP